MLLRMVETWIEIYESNRWISDTLERILNCVFQLELRGNVIVWYLASWRITSMRSYIIRPCLWRIKKRPCLWRIKIHNAMEIIILFMITIVMVAQLHRYKSTVIRVYGGRNWRRVILSNFCWLVDYSGAINSNTYHSASILDAVISGELPPNQFLLIVGLTLLNCFEPVNIMSFSLAVCNR